MKRAVVVGTGVGGAMIARELAGRFEVTVLESGRPFAPFKGDLGRIEKLRASRLFFDPRAIRLLFPEMQVGRVGEGMALIRGRATGGTTTLATANALRCDEALIDRGIDLAAEFDRLAEELPISTSHSRRWRPVTRDLFTACEKLGLAPEVTPKLVDYGRCVRCGRCVFGCPTGAKWDSRRLLDEAVAGGALVRTETEAESLAMGDDGSAGQVSGVVVRHRGRRTIIPADVVVIAAGGLGTPALLERSRIPTEKRLFVDPVLCVAAVAEGSSMDAEFPMPFYVRGEGYMISPYFDYLSFFFDREWRRPRCDIVSLMIKLADSEDGAVDARGRVRKDLTPRDHKRLAEAREICATILSERGIPRERMFLGTLNAGHPGGTLPLTGRERLPLHPDRLPTNVYVADSSLLPESLGRPPMLTIMALAQRVARLCTERFG